MRQTKQTQLRKIIAYSSITHIGSATSTLSLSQTRNKMPIHNLYSNHPIISRRSSTTIRIYTEIIIQERTKNNNIIYLH
eukprot:bmy_05502T0